MGVSDYGQIEFNMKKEIQMSGATLDMVQEYPTKQKEHQEPVDKHNTADNAINDFIGHVANLYKIRIHNVFDDRYRIDVWIIIRKPDSICDTYSISQSYFMRFSDGKLTDITIEPGEDIKPW